MVVASPNCNPNHTGFWRRWTDERFGDPPPRWIQEPSVVRDRDGRPQEDFWGSRSRERDLLSVLLICPRIFFCVFIVYCRIVFCYMLLSVGCFGLVVVLAPLFPFGRICFVVLVIRKRGERAVEVAPDI